MTLCDVLKAECDERIGNYKDIPDTLLVSAPHGKGLYLFKDGTVSRVRPGSITGLWLDQSDGALYYAFILHDHLKIARLTEKGETTYIVNTDVGDIHDIRLFDNKLLAVSTVTNEIAVVADSGELSERWKFPGCGDAWHLNCLDVWDGRLVVSAFGQFDWHREWKGNYKGKGFVVDAETRKVLWSGLSQPHSPRMLPDGVKCVCDSQAQRLLVDNHGDIKAVEFPNKYPRGLSFGKEHLYIGLSQTRQVDMLKPEEAGSGLAVVNRKTLTVEQIVPLPVVEIYDVLALPGTQERQKNEAES